MTDISRHVSNNLRNFSCSLSEFRFGKMIGQGGFGEVFEAVHIRTGLKVAIKKLFAKEMKNEDLKSFCREAEILALCDNRFCLNFMGCTLFYPFSIITQFVPCGSLFDALRHKESSPKLTPTDKTKIAMGISHGMEYLHEQGVMHRDLKSLNILLDESKMPIICDFGLSKLVGQGEIEADGDYATKDVGTPHWMAPEQFESNNYNNKIDVYAFGMVMWELLTENAPFKGLNGVQIAMVVCKKNERPALPPQTPKNLRAFISKCWHQDPRMRPTFKEIFREFKKGRVVFPGTDMDAIEEFAKYIKNDEATRAKKGEFKKPPFKTDPNSPQQQYPNQYQQQYQQQVAMQNLQQAQLYQQMQQITPQMQQRTPQMQNIVPQMQSTPWYSSGAAYDFIPKFVNACYSVTPSNAYQFFRNLINVFNTATTHNNFTIVLSKTLSLVKNNEKIMYEMIKSGIFYYFPINDKDFTDISMEIYYHAINYFPFVMSKDFFSIISQRVPDCSKQIIKFLTLYFRPGSHLANINEVYSFMQNYSSIFLEKSGVDFLKLSYCLFMAVPEIKSSRINDLYSNCLKALDSNNTDVVNTSYKIICAVFDKNFIFESSILVKHINNIKTRKMALSFLARHQDFLVKNELIEALLEASYSNKLALVSLYNFIDQYQFAAQWMIDNIDRWIISTEDDVDMLPLVDILTIIFILLKMQQLRTVLVEKPEFISFLSFLVDTKDVELIRVSTTIVLTLANESRIFTLLKESGYFINYLTTVPMLSSYDAINNSLYFVDYIGRITFIDDFKVYIPYLFRMLQTKSSYTLKALSVITVLCQYEAFSAIIRQYDFEPVLSELEKDPQNRMFIPSLRKNLIK